MQSKASIREQMRSWRQARSRRELSTWSEQICLHLRAEERFARARTIHSFWPMADRGEVDIRSLLKSLKDGGRTIWLPIVEDDTLAHARFTGETDLHRAAFGQWEPTADRFPTVAADVILIPALAVDPSGNRVGYGGGFYDRFLAATPAFRVGLAFAGQILPNIAADPWDVPLHAIVSENGWLDTGIPREA
jgi:5-formyltetrahydrofolate cyclo-ligase